ncbi:MAG: hypothetical protein IPP90_15200 [Gemmatimonadaceae bacterium]|nr:hypothetical protein [Gemmatimonadaceae bacterium]
MPKRAHQHEEQRSESALEALLHVESAVAARLERARADAASVLADAAVAVADCAQQAEAALALELAALDAAHAQALTAIAREVAQSAADQVVRYRSVSADDTARLAAVVLADVTGLTAPNRAASTVP